MNREQIIEIILNNCAGATYDVADGVKYARAADEILALQKEEVKEKRSDILRKKLEQEMADRSKQGILTTYGQLPSWKEYEQAALEDDRNEPEFQKWIKDSGYILRYSNEEPMYLKNCINYSTIELYNIWMDAKMQTYS